MLRADDVRATLLELDRSRILVALEARPEQVAAVGHLEGARTREQVHERVGRLPRDEKLASDVTVALLDQRPWHLISVY